MNDTQISKIATSSPQYLITKIAFWINHQSLIFTLCVSLMTLILIGGFNGQGLEETWTIYGILPWIIYLITSWGIGIIIIILAKIMVETTIAQRVDSLAAEKLRRIKSREDPYYNLDNLEGLIPPNKNFNSGMKRLFQQIIKEAKDRKFEASAIIMQPYREESTGELVKITTVQRVALQLGILGTFIGLITAFAGLNLQDTSNSLWQISQALKFSFSTSIAGLEAAIILGLLILVVRQKQGKYFQCMEDSTNTLISLARNSMNEDKFATAFNQVNHLVEQLGNRVYDQTIKIEEQNRKIEEQNTELNLGLSKLGETKDEFYKFIAEIKQVYTVLSPEKMSQQLKESLELATAGIADTLNQNLGNNLHQYNKLNSNLEEMQEHLASQTRQVSKLTQSQQSFVTRLMGNHISKDLKDGIMNASQDIVQNVKETFDTLNYTIVRNDHELKKFNEITQSYLSKREGLERKALRVALIIVSILGLFFFISVIPKLGNWLNWLTF